MSQLLPDPDLEANFARDIVRLQAEVARYGGQLRIRSGRRSTAEQAAIYARKTAAGADRTTVAPPGHSMHERGQAVDFAGSGKSLALAAKLAPQFNIVQAPWKGGPQQDPVHFEPIGARGQAEPSYDTPLDASQARAFQAWKQRYAPMDSGADYDLPGAFLAGMTPSPDGHWPDRFKKPNHPTFSVESQYAVGPLRARAGHWEGQQFVPAGQATPLLPPGSLVPRPAEPMPPPRFTLEGGPHDPQAMALFQAAVLGSRRS